MTSSHQNLPMESDAGPFELPAAQTPGEDTVSMIHALSSYEERGFLRDQFSAYYTWQAINIVNIDFNPDLLTPFLEQEKYHLRGKWPNLIVSVQLELGAVKQQFDDLRDRITALLSTAAKRSHHDPKVPVEGREDSNGATFKPTNLNEDQISTTEALHGVTAHGMRSARTAFDGYIGGASSVRMMDDQHFGGHASVRMGDERHGGFPSVRMGDERLGGLPSVRMDGNRPGGLSSVKMIENESLGGPRLVRMPDPSSLIVTEGLGQDDGGLGSGPVSSYRRDEKAESLEEMRATLAKVATLSLYDSAYLTPYLRQSERSKNPGLDGKIDMDDFSIHAQLHTETLRSSAINVLNRSHEKGKPRRIDVILLNPPCDLFRQLIEIARREHQNADAGPQGDDRPHETDFNEDLHVTVALLWKLSETLSRRGVIYVLLRSRYMSEELQKHVKDSKTYNPLREWDTETVWTSSSAGSQENLQVVRMFRRDLYGVPGQRP